MTREEYEKSVANTLQNMMFIAELKPETVILISRLVQDAFQGWQNDLEQSIVNKIQKWEEVFGEDPNNFYSLGLRHALDVVKELPEGTTTPLEEDHRSFINTLPFEREGNE